MKLGLIGTGKQGQRYLMEKNGGRHIVRSGSREIDYEGLDGVIIATHPAGHKKLALECIERGLPVLVEKPLALTLADCEEILDAAERADLQCMVAHTHVYHDDNCWCLNHDETADFGVAVAQYVIHDRDYSPWLDWGPHLLSLLMNAACGWSARELLERCTLTQGSKRFLYSAISGTKPRYLGGFDRWSRVYYSGAPDGGDETPMACMVDCFTSGNSGWSYNETRAIYRALFLEEHGQGSK